MMKLNCAFVFIIYQLAAYDMNCPVPSERNMRSKTVCADYRNYTCLFDENTNSFKESCSVRSDFQRPGYRVTLRTNIHARACEDDLYQPFIFYTNTSSDCEMQRSFCSEKGQIVSNDGTIKTDRQCRCNYAEGYTYVTKPTNVCSCIPSLEDCSCYRKSCPGNYILSPDYKCIDQFFWSGQFVCSSISDLRIPISNVSKNTINSKTAEEDFPRKIPVLVLSIVLPSVLVLIVIIVLQQENIPEIELYKSNNTLGVFIKGKAAADAQCTISLKNVKDSFITQANMEITTGQEQNNILKKEDFRYQPTEITELTHESSFLNTDFFTKIKEKIALTNCMLLWGKSGCGKTTSLNFIALFLQDHFGYTTVICHEPSDILKHQFGFEKHTFVIDDICGRFVYSHKRFLEWTTLEKNIKRILQDDNVKLLMTCSRVVFINDTVQQFNLFKDNAIEISIPNIRTPTMHTNAEYSSGCLPLSDDLSYFYDASKYYISKVNELRKTNRAAFCALVICVLKSGCIDEADLTSDGTTVLSKLCSDVCNALDFDMSLGLCLNDLIVLMDIFLSKENGSLFIKKASVFEVLAVYFGNELQNIFLEFADPGIIIQHCFLKTCSLFAENETFSIQVTEENENLYFQRVAEILSSEFRFDVYFARPARLSLYLQKFFEFLSKSSDKKLFK